MDDLSCMQWLSDTTYKVQETHTNNKASGEFEETANINFNL